MFERLTNAWWRLYAWYKLRGARRVIAAPAPKTPRGKLARPLKATMRTAGLPGLELRVLKPRGDDGSA